MTNNAISQADVRVIIVDDETVMRENLQSLLQKLFPGISVLAQWNSLAEVKKYAGQFKPDLVFLDVEMMDGTGFDVYEALMSIYDKFQVIFVTAHHKYAVKAFKTTAVDYLLKPVQEKELEAAVHKALRQHAEPVDNNQLHDLLTLIHENLTRLPPKISIMCTGGIEYVDPDEIIRIEAHGNYSVFHNIFKDDIISTKILKEYEAYLRDYNFIRVHSSHIINVKHISHISKTDGGYITLQNQKRIPISKKYRQDFAFSLKSMGIQYA